MLRPCLSLGDVHLKNVQCAGATTVICCQLFAFAHNSGKQHSVTLQVWRLWTKSCIFASHFQESKIHLQLRLSSVAPNPFEMFSFFWSFKYFCFKGTHKDIPYLLFCHIGCMAASFPYTLTWLQSSKQCLKIHDSITLISKVELEASWTHNSNHQSRGWRSTIL